LVAQSVAILYPVLITIEHAIAIGHAVLVAILSRGLLRSGISHPIASAVLGENSG
jgi:hypothetical protein